MDEKRLEELFSNQEFVNALGAADKAEEVVRIFAEHDVEVSKEDAEALLAARDKAPRGRAERGRTGRRGRRDHVETAMACVENNGTYFGWSYSPLEEISL